MSLNIQLPLELAPVDKSCVICLDDLSFPVFCRQCKQPACFSCLETWFAQRTECPTCRQATGRNLDPELKRLYSCEYDGSLAELFCEQCNLCICRKCQGQGQHLRHPVRELDALRKEIQDGIDIIRRLESEDIRCKAVTSIRVLLPAGTPKELVMRRGQVLAEIKNALPVVSLMTAGKKPPYVKPSDEFTDHRCKIININSDADASFTHHDSRGNTWTLVVYPRGFSNGKGKFISMYLTLLAGTPGRYEYRYMIFENNSVKPLAEYFALDDFNIGTRSQGSQRLVQINNALQKAVNADGSYQISYGTRPTIAAYGPQCSALLTKNKAKMMNFNTFIYTVRDFRQQKLLDRILFSNLVYDHQNIAWRFRVDCNGHQDQGSFLSAYVVLLNGAQGWFDIFIKLVHPTEPQLTIRKDLTHYFTVHSSWGIPCFVDLALTNSYTNEHGNLHFEYGMRPARDEREIM